MSFVPIIPMGGIGGWKFLNRTLVAQKTAADADPALKRDEDYFRAKVGSVKTAEELVSDRRLMKVALGAFGLDDDINNRYFIRKVLEEGTTSGDGLASKLANKSYEKLSAAFGFGDYDKPLSQGEGFADAILDRYSEMKFEAAVGDQNEDMRLALNARRELTELAESGSSDNTKWFKILGSSPLRNVFQTAFGLPTEFGSIDLDQQVESLKQKMTAAFGDDSITQLADPEVMEKFLHRFLVRSDTATQSTSAASAALTILQGNSGSASGSILSIIS